MGEITHIAVCGLGKLGAPIAAVLADAGFHVTGFDLDPAKVQAINEHRAPVEETGLASCLQNIDRGALDNFFHPPGSLSATLDVGAAVSCSRACCFITPTPSLPDGSFSNEFLIIAMTSVAREVKKQNLSDYLFIINSTTTPGSCDEVFMPLLKNELEGLPFHVAYKPEFIALGTVVRDLQCPDFSLFGVSDEESFSRTIEIYGKVFVKNCTGAHLPPFKRMTLLEAELAKIANNCFRTMKVSFANQVGILAKELGADPDAVTEALAIDPRIGRAWLRFGLPFGGPCWPRDNRLFQHVAQRAGCSADLATATDKVNKTTTYWLIDQVLMESNVGDIGILGQSYKPATAVTEESPGVYIAEFFRKIGRTVKTHDPQAPHSHSLEDVLACPIVLVATTWPEYEEISCAAEMILVDPMKTVKKRNVISSAESTPA